MARSLSGKVKEFFKAAKLYNRHKTQKYKPKPLIGVDLRGIGSINFNLYDVELIDCDLRGVKFVGKKVFTDEGGEFEKVNFKGSDLSNAVVHKWTQFDNCIFDDCNLSRITIADVGFLRSSFRNADLLYANMMGTTFRQCDFRNIDMSGAMVDEVTNFAKSKFNKFKMPDPDKNYSLYKSYYRGLIETFDLAFEYEHLTSMGLSPEEAKSDYEDIINAPI